MDTPITPEQVDTKITEAITEATAFSKRKLGDTPTDNDQLTPKGWVDGQIASVISSVTGGVTSIISSLLAGFGSPAVFGTGGDGVLTLNGINNYAIASITASSVYTAARDIYGTVITVSPGITLRPNQFRIFASSVFQTINASVTAKGNDAVGNAGGAGLAEGYFPSVATGVVGGTAGVSPGGAGGGNVGGPGNTGFSTTHSLVGDGIASRSIEDRVGGPAAAFIGGIGGASAAGGIGSGPAVGPIPYWGVQYYLDVNADATLSKDTVGAGSASGPGGGSGARSSANQPAGNGGGGGGAGGNGGWVALYAKHLSFDGGSIIDIRGGNGGDADNGRTPSVINTGQAGGGAGGAGGSGGQGGYLSYMYNTINMQASILNAGGFAGNGGLGAAGVNGGGAGDAGKAGFNGNPGLVAGYKVTN